MDLILLDACSFPLSVERIAKIWGQFVATCVERKAFQTSENKLHYQKLRKWIRCTCWIRVYCAIHPNKVFAVLLWVHLMGSYCIVHSCICFSFAMFTVGPNTFRSIPAIWMSKFSATIHLFTKFHSEKKPKICTSFSLSKQNQKPKLSMRHPFSTIKRNNYY